MKLYFKTLGYILSLILILTFILTLGHYFNLINQTILNIGKIIIPSLAVLCGGYRLGYNSVRRGWLVGLKLGIGLILIFLLIILIFQLSFVIKNILYYTIILITTMLGSMVGISRKPTAPTNSNPN